jgi:hypothetical protein
MNMRLVKDIKAAGLATLMLGVCVPPAAQAIPAGQRDIDTGLVATSSRSFALVPNSSVTVDNGNTARSCIIQFSADARTAPAGDRIIVGFAIGAPTVGAGACLVLGNPAFFQVSSTGLLETATTVHVRDIGAGTRTIKACFALNNVTGNGGNAVLESRSLTVECGTQ